MKYRTLGQGLKVSALGIGCMPMVAGGNIVYGHASDDESIATIHRAIDLGITFFDTAEMYGPFLNETLVGKAIAGKREGLVIATKFAMRWNGNQPTGLDGSPENARRACEGSLRRLGIETIEAAPEEEWGLNLLCLSPGRVLMAEGSPRSADVMS